MFRYTDEGRICGATFIDQQHMRGVRSLKRQGKAKGSQTAAPVTRAASVTPISHFRDSTCSSREWLSIRTRRNSDAVCSVRKRRVTDRSFNSQITFYEPTRGRPQSVGKDYGLPAGGQYSAGCRQPVLVHRVETVGERLVLFDRP